MDSRIKLNVLLTTFILAVAATVCFGQAESGSESATAGDINEAGFPPFPYFAEITSDDVYIRSGPGTPHYQCGKLNKGDIVKVVSRKFSWSRIVPPQGCFSWISKQYVTIDSENPDFGIVTGDNVRVYAGSPYREPIHSEQVQLELDKGEKVRLLGEEKSDYYKIAPPQEAYLWISTEYTKPIEATEQLKQMETEQQAEPTEPKPTVVPTTVSPESAPLNKYYALRRLVEQEHEKPLPQQDYSKLKQMLEETAKDEKAGKAARYAEYTLDQIKRYELAAAVDKEDHLQDQQLKDIYERIDKAYSDKMADFQDLGKFAVIGTFQRSNVYGPEEELLHYVIVDAAGKVICYALPTGSAAAMDMAQFVDKKVGLVGTIEPHPQTSGALVRFDQVELVK